MPKNINYPLNHDRMAYQRTTAYPVSSAFESSRQQGHEDEFRRRGLRPESLNEMFQPTYLSRLRDSVNPAQAFGVILELDGVALELVPLKHALWGSVAFELGLAAPSHDTLKRSVGMPAHLAVQSFGWGGVTMDEDAVVRAHEAALSRFLARPEKQLESRKTSRWNHKHERDSSMVRRKEEHVSASHAKKRGQRMNASSSASVSSSAVAAAVASKAKVWEEDAAFSADLAKQVELLTAKTLARRAEAARSAEQASVMTRAWAPKSSTASSSSSSSHSMRSASSGAVSVEGSGGTSSRATALKERPLVLKQTNQRSAVLSEMAQYLSLSLARRAREISLQQQQQQAAAAACLEAAPSSKAGVSSEMLVNEAKAASGSVGQAMVRDAVREKTTVSDAASLQARSSSRWNRSASGAFERARAAAWSEERAAERFSRAVEGVAVAPGLVALLQQLRVNEIPVAVVSALPLPLTRALLNAAGLSCFFNEVNEESSDSSSSQSSQSSSSAQSAPSSQAWPHSSALVCSTAGGGTALLEAALRLERAPARCAVLGVSPGAIEAAREAGMCSVAVIDSSPFAVTDLSAADFRLSDLGQLTPRALCNFFAHRTAPWERELQLLPQPETRAKRRLLLMSQESDVVDN